MRRPCLAGCGALTSESYCARHRPRRQQPYRYRPQYSGPWQRLSREQRQRVPYCEWCGTEDDLCADHLVPGRPEYGLQTLCRSCNSRRRG